MKARVQYNDFTGTVAAAADPELNRLEEFSTEIGINIDRYEPIGTKFFPHHQGNLSISVICLDKEKSTDEEPYIVNIAIKDSIKYAEYFGLFQGFEAILVKDYYQQFEIRHHLSLNEMGGSNE